MVGGKNWGVEKAECNEKQKEVEGLANPVLKKAYESVNAGTPDGDNDCLRTHLNGLGDRLTNHYDPSVEEVD